MRTKSYYIKTPNPGALRNGQLSKRKPYVPPRNVDYGDQYFKACDVAPNDPDDVKEIEKLAKERRRLLDLWKSNPFPMITTDADDDEE